MMNDTESLLLLLVMTDTFDVASIAVKVPIVTIPKDFIKYFKEEEYEEYRKYLLGDWYHNCTLADVAVIDDIVVCNS